MKMMAMSVLSALTDQALLNSLRTCRPSSLRTCLPSSRRTCLPSSLRTCRPSSRKTCRPSNRRTCRPSSLRTYRHIHRTFHLRSPKICPPSSRNRVRAPPGATSNEKASRARCKVWKNKMERMRTRTRRINRDNQAVVTKQQMMMKKKRKWTSTRLDCVGTRSKTSSTCSSHCSSRR